MRPREAVSGYGMQQVDMQSCGRTHKSLPAILSCKILALVIKLGIWRDAFKKPSRKWGGKSFPCWHRFFKTYLSGSQWTSHHSGVHLKNHTRLPLPACWRSHIFILCVLSVSSYHKLSQTNLVCLDEKKKWTGVLHQTYSTVGVDGSCSRAKQQQQLKKDGRSRGDGGTAGVIHPPKSLLLLLLFYLSWTRK